VAHRAEKSSASATCGRGDVALAEFLRSRFQQEHFRVDLVAAGKELGLLLCGEKISASDPLKCYRVWHQAGKEASYVRGRLCFENKD
jgi:hypothetical protein